MKRVFFSMKYSMTISFSLITVILISALGTLSCIHEERQLHKSIYETRTLAAELAAESIDYWMQMRISALEAKATLMEQDGTVNLLKQGGYSNNPYLKGNAEKYGVDLFYLGLPDGRFIYGGDRTAPENFNAADRPWYIAAVKRKDTIITDYYMDAGTGRLNISVAAPIYSFTGRLEAVLGMDIDLAGLKGLLEAHQTRGTVIALIDQKGDIVAHSDENVTGANIMDLYDDEGKAFMNSVMSRSMGYHDFILEGEKRAVFFNEIPRMSWKIAVIVDEEALSGPLKTLRLQIILFVLGALIINVLPVFIISSLFVRRITDISDSLQEISEGNGDLTRNIRVLRRDELSVLAKNFNDFTSLIRSMISGIKKRADSTMAVKDRLLVSTGETVEAVNEISNDLHSVELRIKRLDESIGNVSGAVEHIDNSVTVFDHIREEQAAIVARTAASIEQMMHSLNQVSSISLEKKDHTRQLTETSRKGSDQLENMSREFNENVVSRLAAIEDMTSIIKEISSRINLLSMNAAIEAAHAGDSGRGFAVVADEIRKLAESSSRSVKNIDRSVKEIRNGVDDTVRNTKETADIFDEMYSVVDEFVGALNQIAENTNALTTGGQEIGSNSRRLTEITVTIKESAEGLKSCTGELKNKMETVKDVSGTVLSGIQEAVSGSNEIARAMTVVNELSHDLASDSEDFMRGIDRFKTGEQLPTARQLPSRGPLHDESELTQ